VRHRGGQARPLGAHRRSCKAPRREDPHLRRRPLQLHQHQHAAAKNFLSANPNFCISALRRYTQRDFIALVERYGIAYHEKTLGQLFCDGSAKQIIDMLLDRDAGQGRRCRCRPN
jgi:hypothetical protein